jgi:hypothetical protein
LTEIISADKINNNIVATFMVRLSPLRLAWVKVQTRHSSQNDVNILFNIFIAWIIRRISTCVQ